MKYIALLIGLDQITKHFARHLEAPVNIFPGFQFRFAENPGIAFSWSVPLWILIPVILLVIGFLSYQLIKKQLTKLEPISYVLILSGAVGNLIDRIVYTKVTDFISVGSFPIFNIADSLISIGVGLLIWEELKPTSKQ